MKVTKVLCRSFTILILSITLSVVAWAAADLGAIYTKIAEIQTTISNSKEKYSEDDVQAILVQLDKTLELARNPSGEDNGPSPACQQAASNYGLHGKDLINICKRSTDYSPACIAVAHDYGLRGSDIVTGCNNSPSKATISCFAPAHNYGLISTVIGKFCRSVIVDPSACIVSAHNYGLRGENIALTCKNSTDYSSLCISTAHNYGLTDILIANLCSEAYRGQDKCILSSYDNGLRKEQIVESCKR